MERKGESLEDLRIRNSVKEFSHLQFNLSSGSSPYTCYLISCANSKEGGCRQGKDYSDWVVTRDGERSTFPTVSHQSHI